MGDGRARMLELFDGHRLSVQLPELPNAGTRRLLAFLGVEVEIVTTQSVTRCPHFPRCSWNFVGPESRGSELTVVHVNLMHAGDFGSNGPAGPDAGRAALDAMDRGEPQRDLTALIETRDCIAPSCDREADGDSAHCRVHGDFISPTSNAVPVSAPEREVETVEWTRESIVECMKAWHREHGQQPRASQWMLKGVGRPTVDAVKKVFGSWGAALNAAGFEAPKRGGSKPGHKRAAASRATSAPPAPKPEPRVTPAVEPTPVAEGTFEAKAERILAAARALDEAQATLAAAETAVQAATDEWVNALGEAA